MLDPVEFSYKSWLALQQGDGSAVESSEEAEQVVRESLMSCPEPVRDASRHRGAHAQRLLRPERHTGSCRRGAQTASGATSESVIEDGA
jgi:hypothetical protein